MSYDYGDDDDDVVVNREGGYYGGGFAMPSFISDTARAIGKPINKILFKNSYNYDQNPQNWTTGYIVLALLVVCVILLAWFAGWLGTRSGYGNDSGGLRFAGESSQPMLSTFMNNRDAPYFPDVTNDGGVTYVFNGILEILVPICLASVVLNFCTAKYIKYESKEFNKSAT
jgi:hypothetical protein